VDSSGTRDIMAAHQNEKNTVATSTAHHFGHLVGQGAITYASQTDP